MNIILDLSVLRTIYCVVSVVITVLYTFFAPEAFFHNTYKKENPKLFDRWKDKRLAWNIHQSFIHFLGAVAGFTSLGILFFNLGIADPTQYGLTHLILFLIGIAGVMGFLPRIFFGSVISK